MKDVIRRVGDGPTVDRDGNPRDHAPPPGWRRVVFRLLSGTVDASRWPAVFHVEARGWPGVYACVRAFPRYFVGRDLVEVGFDDAFREVRVSELRRDARREDE